jgi:hypothetical protein
MDINWPEVFAGVALGLTPALIISLYRYIRYVRLPGSRKFVGRWYVYHRSTMGTGKLLESHSTIKYSIVLNRFSLTRESDTLNYRGTMSGRQGMVRYLSLKDSASHEQITWYIIDPFDNDIDTTIGLYLALDLHGLPACGPMLLSRKQLLMTEVESRLPDTVVRVQPL